MTITYTQKYNRTFKGKSKRLFLNRRLECKNKNIYFDLDEEWILERMKIGCTLSGIKFKLDANEKPHPMSPSIDRINPKLGYTKDNCRMILHSLNMFKSSETDNIMYYIANKLIENKGKINIEDEITKDKKNNNPKFLELDNNLITHLQKFFTNRQIEIIHKKYQNIKLTKTESEYYSRIIKKKIKSIASENIFKISKQILNLF